MIPNASQVSDDAPSGIQMVVKHYQKHLPEFGIEIVDGENYDLYAVHAGATVDIPNGVPFVAHCHGLYWCNDYPCSWTEHDANRRVIHNLRRADAVVVPSEWVAGSIKRNMHFSPYVVPHGIDADAWKPGNDKGYVLWNKNRSKDACDPSVVHDLAYRAREKLFLTTFYSGQALPNVKVTGAVPHSQMKEMIQDASVYLSTAKETFGIGTLEAMASGLPILGYDYGGTRDLVMHGVNGYLAEPGNIEDLLQGLDYCYTHRHRLGQNSISLARDYYSWERACSMLAQVYRDTLTEGNKESGVTVVIPCYNKARTLLRAVVSATTQELMPERIVIVNNNSTEDLGEVLTDCEKRCWDRNVELTIVNCEQQGVAHARNMGVRLTDTPYVCCLDADDEIKPMFLKRCVAELNRDTTLGVAYTRLSAIDRDGQEHLSRWPEEYDFNQFLNRKNQVPTCAVFRKESWVRAGGYRQRYAPHGAGSEDADFWLRLGLLGYGGKLCDGDAQFRYYLGGQVSGDSSYQEVDWVTDKTSVRNRSFPFACLATPANRISHIPRHYDNPKISVIVPCSEKHLVFLVDALDSVENQTFDQWELIVVFDYDFQDCTEAQRIQNAYPYAIFTSTTSERRGAGAARNIGVEHSSAPLLIYLDADDWFDPYALEKMYAYHQGEPESVIYSDYNGHAFVYDTGEISKLHRANRLVGYDNKSGVAHIRYRAAEYDCEKAARQPEPNANPYIWNVVSSLVPRSFHDKIGGFDENMPSWEDWDYWIRMARSGFCFTRVPEPLLEYRFFSGTRRKIANPDESGDDGRQLSIKLLKYLREKKEQGENMGCRSCGGRKRTTVPQPISASTWGENTIMANTSSGEMVKVELVDGNIGDHLISFGGTNYGYRKSGDQFYMKQEHAKLDRRVRILEQASAQPSQSVRKPPPAPPNVDEAAAQEERPKQDAPHVDESPKQATTTEQQVRVPSESDVIEGLAEIWGIGEERAKKLFDIGVRTPSGVVAMGESRLTEVLGANTTTVKRIMVSARELIDAKK